MLRRSSIDRLSAPIGTEGNARDSRLNWNRRQQSERRIQLSRLIFAFDGTPPPLSAIGCVSSPSHISARSVTGG
jgi:hypothetical protein